MLTYVAVHCVRPSRTTPLPIGDEPGRRDGNGLPVLLQWLLFPALA